MGKIILLLVLAFVVYAMIKGSARRKRQSPAAEKPAETMVACARCKVHLPETEAIEDGGAFFCSEEHRRLGAR